MDDVRLSSFKGAPRRVDGEFEINPFTEDDLSGLDDIDANIEAKRIIIRGSSILRDGSPVSQNNTVTVSNFLYIGRTAVAGHGTFSYDIMVSNDNTDMEKLDSILGPKVWLKGNAKLYIDNHGGDPAYK